MTLLCFTLYWYYFYAITMALDCNLCLHVCVLYNLSRAAKDQCMFK